MKAKELQAEIEEALLRGLEVFLSNVAIDPKSPANLRTLMKERAANLAAGLYQRTLSDATRTAYDINTSYGAAAPDDATITLVMKDLEG